MGVKKKPDTSPSLAERAADYCKTGEKASMYLDGLADGLEATDAEKWKTVTHRLRHFSHELNYGTLYVNHGYRDSDMKMGRSE